MSDTNIAIYLDFENLAISAEQVYPSKNMPLNLTPILDYAASLGNVCIKKAYGDWLKPVMNQYQRTLVELGFELVHLPETTSQGKNGGDVRLAIDAMENLELFKLIDIFIIGSGDTDFIPLIQRIRSRGKIVIGFGFEHSVGRLTKSSCNEFKSLQELLGEPDKDTFEEPDADHDSLYGRDLLIRFINNRSSEEPVPMAQLKIDLLRLDPSFSEKKMGYASFKKFLADLVGDVVEKIETDPDNGLPVVSFKDIHDISQKTVDKKEKSKLFLQNVVRYPIKSIRINLAKSLYGDFKKEKTMSIHQMIEIISKELPDIQKIVIRKYLMACATGQVFKFSNKDELGPVFNRVQILNERITSPDMIDEIYQETVVQILESRFHGINAPVVMKAMEKEK